MENIRVGQGRITVECRQDGSSVASELFANYPCRLHLTSRPNNLIDSNNNTKSNNISKALTSYVLGYGGGLISGDSINLEIKVKSNASLVVTSQSTSKAFKAVKDRDATFVKTNAFVGKGGLLFLVPQPIQCFGGSNVQQMTQVVLDGTCTSGCTDSRNSNNSISEDGDDPSLLLVDWYTGGRRNMDGGLWNMESFHSTITISYSKQPLFPEKCSQQEQDKNEHIDDAGNTNIESDLIFRDATRLSGGHHLLRHMRHFNIVCMLVLIGPRVKKISDLLLDKFSSRYIYEDDSHLQSDSTSGTNDGKPGGLNQNRGEGLNESNEGLLVSCGPLNISPPGSASCRSKQKQNGVIVRLAADSLEIAGMSQLELCSLNDEI